MSRYKIDPYLLSDEEKIILDKLSTHSTPLLISRNSGIPRSTVYFLLLKLKKRGFVIDIKSNKKVIWRLNMNKETDNVDEFNPQVKFYRNKEEIDKFLSKLISDDNDRLKGFSGDNVSSGWKKNVGIEKIINFNNFIKENSLISELITSNKYFNQQIKEMGKDWAVSHSDRPCEFNIMPQMYSGHSGQIFIKSEYVYLIDMSKPLVIEIKNSNIKNMIESIFSFIKDNTKSTNINDYIKNILDRKSSE